MDNSRTYTNNWPSLFWPPFSQGGYALVLESPDVWRFTVIWTLIFYAVIYGAAGLWAWAVFYRSRWSFMLPIIFVAVALLTGLVGGTIVGYALKFFYQAGEFNMSTWVPFLWGLTQALVAVMGSYSTVTTIL
ncbi:5445_t:CDS:2 [Ambispora gerdemannii]|uniref:5445_t:CDS:1 n=1 Tax=Ambispora gerdemannii TaxID=144530 RepID=A0A9N9EVX6_9GLOM|nr:5445_t:CDS:2 [Ambispora gerdemannii]